MQAAEKASLATVVDPQDLVSDQLLKKIHGEVLLIRSIHATTICAGSAGNMKQKALSWLHMAATEEEASFIAGCLSNKGGRFQIIDRSQAVGLIARWISAEIKNSFCWWKKPGSDNKRQ